jgi:hypothetical protein
VQAAGERLDQRRDLRREPVRDAEEVDPSDPFRNGEQLGVRTVQEPEVVEVAVRVGGDDSAAGRDVDPAELVAERAGRIAEQDWVAAPEGLQVGAVRQRDLDANEHLPSARLRVWHLLDAEVAGPVEDQRPHGTKTTLSASRRT